MFEILEHLVKVGGKYLHYGETLALRLHELISLFCTKVEKKIQ